MTQIQEYSQTEQALAELRQRYEGATFDLSTTAGDKAARAARAEVKGYRVALEAKRKEIKAPALEHCRLIDAEAARITDELLKLEKPIDEQIKAEEKRIAAEKAEKERIEAERAAAIQSKLTNIRSIPAQFVGASSADIQAAIDLAAATETTLDEYAEFTGEAMQAKAQTISALADLLTKAQAHEAEQERMAAEREELNRLRAEQAERERIAQEQQKAAEAAARAEREAYEAKIRADQLAEQEAARKRIEEMQAQQAEIDRQRRELEEQQRAAAQAEADRKAEAERIEREAAEAKAKAKREKEERKAREQFMQDGPDPKEIITLIAEHYGVPEKIAMNWLSRQEFSELLAA